MESSEKKGCVYILTNPSFSDDWVKIGKSSRPVDIRSKELDNTSIPLPFDIYAILETRKYEAAEAHIHKMIDLVNPVVRIRKGREFFNVTPEKALEILECAARLIDDAEIKRYVDEGCADNSSKNTRLTFKMINIPVGSELIFAEDNTKTTITIDDRNHVRLPDGTETTLSYAACLVKRDLGTSTPSECYQGGYYWLYNGKKLTEIRAEMGLQLSLSKS